MPTRTVAICRCVASMSEALDNVIAEIDTLMYHARQKIDVIYS